MIQALKTLCIATSVLLVSQAMLAAKDSSAPDSTQVWTFKQKEHGWTPYRDCTLDVKDNLLQVNSTGKDPHFGRELKSPAGWKKVKVRLRAPNRLR